MAQRLIDPFIDYADSTGLPYSGGSLAFYASNSSTPLDTYNDPDLAAPHANTNPVVLNSAGRPSVAIFLQNLPYKVVLSDSLGNVIWTADPVTSSDFASFPITKIGSGSPSGSVAGTAGSSGVLPTLYWDYLNSILYVCTATGTALTATWAAINATAATTPNPPPQGRLTLTSATPVISVEVADASAVYYTPHIGNICPIYNGSTMVNQTFAELTLALVASHSSGGIYDVFVFLDSGVVTIGTGPVWGTLTAGLGARGSGAGTTQLARLNGFLVNAQSITARNGSTTYTVAGNYATYVGSIYINGTGAGQVTCHNTYGQSRTWGVFNAYNRSRIVLQAGDGTASWSYNTATVRASNNASANKITLFHGLAEEWTDINFKQRVVGVTTTNLTIAQVGIGFNSTTVMSGTIGVMDNNDGTFGSPPPAVYCPPPFLGLNIASALENAADPASTSITWYGTSTYMLLRAEWMG